MRENFAKPGNALKRAKEFIEVGKKEQALACLNDVINSKKHRTWTKVHQEIIFMHIQLCVETRNNNQCKEGLHQYKKICQQVNINSLDASIRHYLALAEDKANQARQESRDIVSALECEDLEQDVQTYEGLLLSTVTDDSTQERTDRVTLLPWVKFLWEAYRTVLDMLRNNAKVETLYQETAQRAFKFCVEYGRRNEFRRLCDNLRNHMNQVIKQQGSQYGINLNVEQSMQMHIETRLIQVDCAIKMELWQEAFKAVEDIHGLTTMSRKPPKPQLMANFYQTLALVLWKAGNYLFHACAHHRLYILSREQKKTLTSEENERLATNVLLSTLAIPLTTQRNLTERPYEADDEKSRRLATILGCINVPTRSSLLKDLNKLNVLQVVSVELQNLYRYMELDFQPLCLCGEISKLFKILKSENDLELDRYIPQLEIIAIMKQMKQISQVYQTVRFSRLVNLIPFADQHRLEKIIVEAARHDLEVKIDHSTKSYIFGSNVSFYSSEKDDILSGPVIQSMPSDVIRSQLLIIYGALRKASFMITPERKEKENARLEQLVQKYKRNRIKQHASILKRKDNIERRKEAIEKLHEQRVRGLVNVKSL
ncbi:uncharacterized protein TRIADDRAFT_50583 [Trichoplax adhaerens]|uniref:eIF3a PCI domain-containing protein n=1 Tax=Trichoplax adhaerens TaxID=10228 RepID=B3S2S1_TRIAD|nr:hypothetical protein TRIADDRAFT_50583 [Trichoplax adhaerens]EDV22839.1 hypothetical protein TRIADDRAFT_50583 [Trichoplax adhaerens]|eukprot:XP_002114705.1 hypothetical protein TRIADDRAFT_50583 [Trichoplax adhaerens]